MHSLQSHYRPHSPPPPPKSSFIFYLFIGVSKQSRDLCPKTTSPGTRSMCVCRGDVCHHGDPDCCPAVLPPHTPTYITIQREAPFKWCFHCHDMDERLRKHWAQKHGRKRASEGLAWVSCVSLGGRSLWSPCEDKRWTPHTSATPTSVTLELNPHQIHSFQEEITFVFLLSIY